MDKLKKVGLTALGTALVSTSAMSADVAVTGGATLTFTGGDKDTAANGFSFLDSLMSVSYTHLTLPTKRIV